MRIPVAVVLVCLLSAGCVELVRTEPFAPVAVPAWNTGDWWTYRSTTVLRGTHGESPIDEPPRVSDVTLRVVSDNSTFDGIPVYRVAIQGDPYAHAILRAPELAIGRADLSLIAGCVDSYPEYTNWNPNCGGEDGAREISRIQPDTVFPWLRFPIEDGTAVHGTWKRYDEKSLDYTAEPQGMVNVTVPAGTFRAVWVHVTFQASRDYGTPGESAAVADYAYPDMTSDYYYAPSVGNIVKHVIEGSSGTYRGSLVFELKDFGADG